MDRPVVRDLIPIERVWARLEAVEAGLRRATTSTDPFLTRIAQHLLAHIGGREGRALRLSPDTLAAMTLYRWPGNVRELGNALEYAVATCTGQTIQIASLPS